jgi:hypothetical protein
MAMRTRHLALLGCAFLLEGAGALLFHRASARLEHRIRVAGVQERQLQATLQPLRRKNQEIAAEVERLEHLPPTLTRGEQFAAVEAFRLLGALGDLKEWVRAAQPRPHLPEMVFLLPKDWVEAAGALGDGRQEADFERAWRKIRDAALVRFSPILQEAVQAYAREYRGNFPNDPGELAPFIPGMDGAALRCHYRIAEGPDGKSIRSIDHVLNLDDPGDDEASIRVNASIAVTGTGVLYPTPTPTPN